MTQLTIEHAIAAGQHGMQVSMEAATRRDPEFAAKAEALFVHHLAASRDHSAWGEDLVDVARAHGVVPQDDRAFGSVFQSMARRQIIVCVEYGIRRKGRGTAGARRWRLFQ